MQRIHLGLCIFEPHREIPSTVLEQGTCHCIQKLEMNQVRVFGLNMLLLTCALVPAAASRPLSEEEIPMVDRAEFIPAAQAGFLEDDELVLGVALGGEAKAYPIRILGLYEVINDRFGDTAIAATW